MSADARIAELGIELPPPFPPAGIYVNAVRTGNLLVLGGHIPFTGDSVVLGKLGDDLEVDAGRDAARLAALSALATLREELGTLDRVVRIVSLRGVVNATPDFIGHTQVIDGASEVFESVFGARHARLAVGVSSLPANLALEIELIVEIEDSGG